MTLLPPSAVPVLQVVLAVLAGLTGLLAVAAVAVNALATREEARRAARWARWEPALLDALVGDRPPSSVALLAPADARGDYFRLLTAYALRFGGGSRAALAEAAGPHLDAAHRWLRHRRDDRRALVAHLFGLVGSPADLRALQVLLRDPSPGVAMTAARALAHSGDLAFVGPVIRSLDRFASWGVTPVASMLALFGAPAGPDLLAALLDDDQSDLARAACAEALRRLGDVAAADGVAALLRADPPPPREVRAAALRLLRDVGGPGHADVARALCDADDEVVRLHAVSALAALGLRPEDVDRVEAALGDASEWVARRAARGLLDVGQAERLRVAAGGDGEGARVAADALAEAGLLLPSP